MLHIRRKCSLSFLCPEDSHSPAGGDMQVAPVYQAPLPIAYTTRTVSGLPLALSPQPSALAQELSVLWKSLAGEGCCQEWPYTAGTCVCPLCPPPVCHCRNELCDVKTCSDLPITCSPNTHFSLHQSPVFIVAVSLEECRRSQHSCVKTELTLCYISSLLTWNSTVSLLADK